ncbi:STAS domain-containing protein [Actinoplanes sp. CA-252034]|uniref:STAS domain-containing protein n=1 Tax=Actinoplanes sp. CA-252034 TaxID=3239906 RepID=UPI003D97C0CB
MSLAEMPDGDAAVDTLLTRIAASAADMLAGVDYASITAWRGAGYITVAASSDLVRAVDDAQYGEGGGPCVLAEQTAVPVTVPDIAATMSWPGFHRQATALGLRASVSVPLFAGGGTPTAVLNLYGRAPAPLVALAAGVRGAFAVEGIPADGFGRAGDAGTRRFLIGLGLALQRRVTIQRAVGAVMAHDGCDAVQAHQVLQERITVTGELLSTAARRVITGMGSDPDTDVHVVVGPPAGDVVAVSVTGELAAPVDAAVSGRLAAVLDEPATTSEWDLSGLRFCDVAGLRLLLGVRDRAVADGRRMRVVAASDAVRTLLSLTETAALFGYPPPAADADSDG